MLRDSHVLLLTVKLSSMISGICLSARSTGSSSRQTFTSLAILSVRCSGFYELDLPCIKSSSFRLFVLSLFNWDSISMILRVRNINQIVFEMAPQERDDHSTAARYKQTEYYTRSAICNVRSRRLSLFTSALHHCMYRRSYLFLLFYLRFPISINDDASSSYRMTSLFFICAACPPFFQ